MMTVNIRSVRFHSPTELELQVVRKERRKDLIWFSVGWSVLVGIVLVMGLAAKAWLFSIIIGAILLLGLVCCFLINKKTPETEACCGTIQHVRVTRKRDKNTGNKSHKVYHFTIVLDDTGDTVEEFTASNYVRGKRDGQHVLICRFKKVSGYYYHVYSF